MPRTGEPSDGLDRLLPEIKSLFSTVKAVWCNNKTAGYNRTFSGQLAIKKKRM